MYVASGYLIGGCRSRAFPDARKHFIGYFNQANGSPSVVPEPAASATPRKLLAMQMIRFHPRPTESETLGLEPTICVLTNLPGESDAH